MWVSAAFVQTKKKPLKVGDGSIVDINGFEPLTFRTSSGCSSS